MEERLCNGIFSFLPMLLVTRVKDQSKLPKSILVGGQCVWIDQCSFDFNDFSLELTKYLMFPDSHFFCVKKLHLQHQSATRFAYFRLTQERWSFDNYPPDVSIHYPSILRHNSALTDKRL